MQVPYIPSDFAFAGSLKNTSKPTDYFGDAKYFKYQKADGCLRPGMFPASHFRPVINSGTDNCKPSSACLEFKMPPSAQWIDYLNPIYIPPPKEVEKSGTESPMLRRSSCCFPKKPKKVPGLPWSTPICTGIILTRKLVLTSATCVISAQAAYDRLSNLQVSFDPRCLKITEKVSFNIASEASGRKLIKMPKMVHFGEFLKP